jgi:hypothetical protein
MTLRWALWGAAIAGAATVVAASNARAQRVDPERPRTLTVGLPPGPRADRVDATRRGRSLPLPASALRVAWRTALGTFVERAPVVDARGGSYMVGVRGDVIALTSDGAERWRVLTGATQPGPLALLSDDTVVFADAAGQAFAVRDGAVRWRTRVGRPDVDSPSPLPLEDGGVVVATPRELALLDVDGNERGRVILPEAVVGPLLWSSGHVIAIGAAGSVWSWLPGAARPERAGAFGSAIDGGAALADDHTLVGVATRDSTLLALDLVHGTTAVRAASSRGVWRGPPAVSDAITFIVSIGWAGERVTLVDPSGEDIGHATLPTRAAAVASGSVDAGAPLPLSLPAGPTPPLVDAAGTFAFATAEGAVGVARFSIGARDRSEAAAESGEPRVPVDALADICPMPFGTIGGSSGPPRPVTALAALPERRLLAVCRSGAVVAFTGR